MNPANICVPKCLKTYESENEHYLLQLSGIIRKIGRKYQESISCQLYVFMCDLNDWTLMKAVQ